jgi:hypothetical protein
VLQRRLLDGLFASEDRKQAMTALVENRAANWKGR